MMHLSPAYIARPRLRGGMFFASITVIVVTLRRMAGFGGLNEQPDSKTASATVHRDAPTMHKLIAVLRFTPTLSKATLAGTG